MDLSFTGSPLDRASARRPDSAWIAARLADPESLVLPLWRLKPLVLEPGRAGFLARAAFPPTADEGLCVFLGLKEGRAFFARDVSQVPEPLLATLFPGGNFPEMRAAALMLPASEAAMLGQARALIDWHARHGFCPNCGARTKAVDGGYRRLCPACGAEHFPRTDPVAIMLPVRGQECLVGRNARFTVGLYSAFAGFIEPGETVEEAVARELREEVDLPVGRITYFASQPWPFPSSLMIGCFAEALSRQMRIDGQEIADARWMHKDEVRARLAGTVQDGIHLPVPIAIAHHLLRRWAMSD